MEIVVEEEDEEEGELERLKLRRIISMKVDLKMVAERLRRSRGMRWGSWRSVTEMGIKSILLMIELRQGLRFTCLFFLTSKGPARLID